MSLEKKRSQGHTNFVQQLEYEEYWSCQSKELIFQGLRICPVIYNNIDELTGSVGKSRASNKELKLYHVRRFGPASF
jgi:hypothetical protein